MDRLQERMTRSVAVNEGYIETIRGLKSQLAEEKSRVLALSSMCGHVRTLSTALSSYGQVHHYSDYFFDYLSSLNFTVDDLYFFLPYPKARVPQSTINSY
jgi:hypothetical protein